MIQSGNKEIITPATGINPSKKIITANTSSCGNPKTINAMTVRIQFTTAIKTEPQLLCRTILQIFHQNMQFLHKRFLTYYL